MPRFLFQRHREHVAVAEADDLGADGVAFVGSDHFAEVADRHRGSAGNQVGCPTTSTNPTRPWNQDGLLYQIDAGGGALTSLVKAGDFAKAVEVALY